MHASLRARAGALLIALLNVGLDVALLAWLFQRGHVPQIGAGTAANWASIVMAGAVAVLETLRLVFVVSMSLAFVLACDPLPMVPSGDLRVAFLTTIVPAREPISLVAHTLRAARDIDCPGLDVWLLDEGDDPDVRAECARLGVRHFTRRGVARYNQVRGRFAARTKHGNYNAWLEEHGADYDVIMCVDPDHVPLPSFANSVLGYFRDEDVAYVVGPQFYANTDSTISRGAESQQFPFHSVVQRAANRYGAAMLVGTNNALRVSALRSVGGFGDSITEDFATGIALHSTRNPLTRRRWKSVYVPDVLARGEGPTSWGDYFSQQMRWSRGSYQVIVRQFLPRIPRLPAGRVLHYSLIASCYPSMALGWLFGMLNALLVAVFGANLAAVSPTTWAVLYANTTLFQIWLYVYTRKHNVSPYDDGEAAGALGIAMSAVSQPMHAVSLVNALLLRRGRFVVTPKGVAASVDGWRTFGKQIWFAAYFAVVVVTGAVLGHLSPGVAIWPALSLVICLAPIAVAARTRRLVARLETSARSLAVHRADTPALATGSGS